MTISGVLFVGQLAGAVRINSFGYDAQYTSTDTGLIYMRARTYDPTTAQFLSRDPLAAITGEPYSYAADDPMDLADPSGRCGLVCWGGIALGGAALATGVGEVAVGGTLAVEGTLGAISVVSGAVGASVDLKECAGGSSVSCVGAITGGVGAAGAFGVATGLLTGGAASGATAVGLTSGGIGFLVIRLEPWLRLASQKTIVGNDKARARCDVDTADWPRGHRRASPLPRLDTS
jgi:RHS repeat-associated protein